MIKTEGGTRIKVGCKVKASTNKSLISIITVCLNSDRYIEDAIKSVINQTYNNIEYIIVDGGSTDGTLDIIRKYESAIDYWKSESDRGIYDAMNKGVSLATGDIVGILNSDDWYHPQAVEQIVKALRENPQADVIYGDLLYVRQEGDFLKKEDCDIEGKYMTRKGSHENMLEKWALYHPACFVKKENYSEHRFNPDLRLSGDYYFMLSLYRAGKKFCYIAQPVVYYRPVGISSKFHYRYVLEHFHIRRKYNMIKAVKCWFLETKECLYELLYVEKEKVKKIILGKD